MALMPVQEKLGSTFSVVEIDVDALVSFASSPNIPE